MRCHNRNGSRNRNINNRSSSRTHLCELVMIVPVRIGHVKLDQRHGEGRDDFIEGQGVEGGAASTVMGQAGGQQEQEQGEQEGLHAVCTPHDTCQWALRHNRLSRWSGRLLLVDTN